MPKPPTAADKRLLRSLLKRLAPDLLPLLPPDLLPHKRGRATHDDASLLASLELFVRNTARVRGITRGAALRVLVEGVWPLHEAGQPTPFRGSSAEAAAARLSRKLREGGFDKRDARTLVPREWLKRGIDPEKFVTFPITKDLHAIDPEKLSPRKLAKLKRAAPGRFIVETDD